MDLLELLARTHSLAFIQAETSILGYKAKSLVS